jgi:hypothetical protein
MSLGVWGKLGGLVVAVGVAATGCVAPPDGGSSSTTTTEASTTTDTDTTSTNQVSTTTTSSTTTTTPPTTTTTVADPDQMPVYPGEVPAGRLRWGAGIQGNGDPAWHEDPTGLPLGLRRTFWRWDQRVGPMVDVVEDDLANDRLPWVSVKPPADPNGSWDDMGAGSYDDQIDEMLLALDASGGPVWLTVHHEPEGGGGNNLPDDPGGPAAWRAMQRRVRERMDALATENVGFAPILMSWTWDPASGRDPEEWWEPGIWDFFAVDHYVDQEASLLDATWFTVREWVGDHGLDLAVGEWGMRGDDAAAGERLREWFEHAIGSAGDGRGPRVIALAAFDSGLNAPTGSWELRGEQLAVFRELMGDDRTVTASEP